MNRLKNDKGEWVAQTGSPGSKVRAACQYPALIEYLNSLFYDDVRIDRAIEVIRSNGISNEQETLRILENTEFTKDPIFGIVKTVTKN